MANLELGQDRFPWDRDGKLPAVAKLNRPHHAAALVRGFPILRSHMFYIAARSLSMKFDVAEVTNRSGDGSYFRRITLFSDIKWNRARPDVR